MTTNMDVSGLKIRKALSAVCVYDLVESKKLQPYLSKQIWNSSDRKAILSLLANLLLREELTIKIAEIFLPILLGLLHQIQLPTFNSNKSKAQRQHAKICFAIGRLVARFPSCFRFAVQYFEAYPSPFTHFVSSSEDDNEPLPKRLKKSEKCSVSELHLLHSAYNYLSLAPDYFKDLWNWSIFLQYVKSEKSEEQWDACQCISDIVGFSDFEKDRFIKLYISGENYEKYLIRNLNFNSKTKLITQHLCEGSLGSKTTQNHTQGALLANDLSSDVLCMNGILLPKYTKDSSFQINNSKQTEELLISVPSTNDNLRSLALAVESGCPVLLQGPVGSGKTALVEHLARLTGRDQSPLLTKIQLNNQADSKVLLGTYRCTDMPGEFVWQPGSLTQAVENGYWILLEDIDSSPMDVISVLLPLLETRSLLLPGHGDLIKAAPGFQLFATQRLIEGNTGFLKIQGGHSYLLDKLWRKVIVDPLSKEELYEVIERKWPNLKPIVNKVTEAYFMLSAGRHSSNQISAEETEYSLEKHLAHDGRLISTRDLLKWCSRISKYFALTSDQATVNTFQDALDCFCSCISKASNRIVIAEALGAKFNLLKSQAEYYCNKHKPDIYTSKTKVTVGRAILPVIETALTLKRSSRHVFSFTRLALALLERIAVAVENKEPVLLVGETGTGKTSSVQFLAEITGHKLIVINLNQQSDSTDLLGGYKPVEMKYLISPLRTEYENLFCKTFSRSQNSIFLNHIASCISQHRWKDLLYLMLHTKDAAIKKLENGENTVKNTELLKEWIEMDSKIHKIHIQAKELENTLAFAFVEGTLVKAIKEGYWVLLDEINLATPETLECLSGLLENTEGSILLLDRGDSQPIPRHPDFHLFACMNPATDIGKKDLPLGIRNRFTEFFVEELEDETDLRILVSDYLKGLSLSAAQVGSIVKFYLHIRKEGSRFLVDGVGHKPNYSLRTLCRALSYAASNQFGNVPRSLYEAFCLSFLTQLDNVCHPIVENIITTYILTNQNISGILRQPVPPPADNYIKVESYWIPQGIKVPTSPKNYIITPIVRQNLKNLARVIAAGKHPVLLQGETSVGKTSLIQWIAQVTGNHCVRVNNHEHTDLQEYVGSYGADQNGKLVFKEGVLVDAMRKGYWIILDELNLAPSEVLEALNRVLDDNRELFIPETQEVIKAHKKFMLFATQNPPGLYGGRKILSRAFRNRFVELHFSEIPSNELETILHERCSMPNSYCKKLVAVMLELQTRRRESEVFAGKKGFITLRDLFRWGERYRLADQKAGKYYDWDQHLADEGYLLLAGRSRRAEECCVIQEVLQKHLKRKVDPECLFSLSENTSKVTKEILKMIYSYNIASFKHIVWTFTLRRLAVLVGKALQFKEPVLLVGRTGCGKTTICQLFAALNKKCLFSVNCHMHLEGADFIGGLRPVRQHEEETDKQKLFEWVDGPLVLAMNEGGYFLADEISLADDSVLERLNSVLEPEQMLLLAEKGSADCDVDIISAKEGFNFLATMNPGGDFGKKELSPALRNRFTEIWCPANSDLSDMLQIAEHNLQTNLFLKNIEDGTAQLGKALVTFLDWFQKDEFGKRCTVSIRDLLAWVEFINVSCSQTPEGDMDTEEIEGTQMDIATAYIHGACLVFLDSLGSSFTAFSNFEKIAAAKENHLKFLMNQMQDFTKQPVDASLLMCKKVSEGKVSIINNEDVFGILPFCISKGNKKDQSLKGLFSLEAPTTCMNALCVLRGMQLKKPILLEGSPGVGKTSLIASIAKVSGHELIRINLSEQTDVSDLFGADLPVENGRGGEFAWRDGPLLQALKEGHWVVLDEMNLASQSVLEGLNACLDHRGEIFIPELGRTFHVKHQTTRIFACQNPFQQGGARKGLPRSFLNRFTQVYIQPLSEDDLIFITKVMYPAIHDEIIKKMVKFNEQIRRELLEGSWGQKGGPWDLNLRDIFRLADVMIANQSEAKLNPGEYIGLLYSDRFRTAEDKKMISDIYLNIFDEKYPLYISGHTVKVTKTFLQVGHSFLPRFSNKRQSIKKNTTNHQLLHQQRNALESLMKCIEMNWLAILVGPKNSGKTSLVQILAELSGNALHIFNMNSSTDTMDLLGGFEQIDVNRHLEELISEIEGEFTYCVKHWLLAKCDLLFAQELFTKWWNVKQLIKGGDRVSCSGDSSEFQRKLTCVEDLIHSLSKTPFCTQEMNSISRKLELMKEGVNKRRQGGGQFEWIDSLLVKALKNGDWLLIDNVNFCSPSVLDRLNGLLEPDGMLSINECGVVNGVIPVVKPHPNFRLIFSMDPKHGEISRAMRNRGLEICIIKEVDGQQDVFDTHLLFKKLGINDYRIQRCLIALHESVQQIISVWERPGLSELHQMASLFIQQLKIGMDVLTSLENSFSEVYIRNQPSISRKQALAIEVEKHIEVAKNTFDVHKQINYSWDYLPSVTMHTEHSSFSNILLDSSVLMYILMTINTEHPPEECFLKKIIHPCSSLRNYLKAAVINFFHKSSVNDWHLRRTWISSFSSINKINQDTNEEINELMSSISAVMESPVLLLHRQKLEQLFTIAEMNTDSVVEDVPFDLRWHSIFLQMVMKDKATEELVKQLDSTCNRIYLLMSFVIQKSIEQMILSQQKLDNRMSPLLISLAIKEGFMSANSLPHQVFAHVPYFFEMLDDYLGQKIFMADLPCNNMQMLKFYEVLQWRNRIWNCASTYVNPGSINLAVAQLSMHWIWFYDCALPFITLNQKGISISRELQIVIAKMNHNFSLKYDANYKQAEKLRKFIGCPKPFKTELILNSYHQIESHCKAIRIWPSIKSDASKHPFKQILYQISSGREIFISLAKLLGCIFSGQFKDEESQLLSSITSVLTDMGFTSELNYKEEKLHLDLNTHSQERCHLQEKIPQLQIFPLLELMNILSISHILQSIIRKKPPSQIIPFVDKFLSHIRNGITSYPEELALFQYVSDKLHTEEEEDAYKNVFSVYSLLLLNYQQRLLRCPATRDYNSWINLQMEDFLSGKINQVEESTLITGPKSLQSPLTSFIITSLMLKFNQNVCAEDLYLGLPINLPLGFCNEKASQFHTVSSMLWQNMDAKTSEKFSTRYSDVLLLTGMFGHLILSISNLIANNDSDVESLITPEMIVLKELMNDLRCKLSSDSEVMNTHSLLRSLVNIIAEFNILDGISHNLLDLSCDAINELQKTINSELKSSKIQWTIGKAWLKFGLLQAFLVSSLGPMDPTQQQAVLLKYCNEEITELEQEVKVVDWMQQIATGISLKDSNLISLHPHIQLMFTKLELLQTKVLNFEDGIASRPTPSQFDALTEDIKHCLKNLVKVDCIHDIEKGYEIALEMKSLNSLAFSVNKLKNWGESIHTFIARKMEQYSSYQDLAMPFLTGISQAAYGIELMTHFMEIQKTLVEVNLNPDALQSGIILLGKFPWTSTEISSGLKLTEAIFSPPILTTLKTVSQTDQLKKLSSDNTSALHSILFSCLKEVFNVILVNNGINEASNAMLMEILKEFLVAWQYQEEEKRRIQEEKESLYQYKTVIHGEEEKESERDKKEIEDLFPSFEKDFQEFLHNNDGDSDMEDKAEEVVDVSRKISEHFKEDDLVLICQIHQSLFLHFTASHWFSPEKDRILKPDYISPFLLRYSVASQMLQKTFHILDVDIDNHLYGGHLMTSSALQDILVPVENKHDKLIVSEHSAVYDVYHDSNIEEVLLSRTVLEALLKRVDELLQEWTDHPTLLEIKHLTNRLLNFSVKSPIVKFAVGLEMLLGKSQEWEMNAHKGVSLNAQLENITELILRYRKLELKCWTMCLDTIANKVQSRASKWLFHLIAVIESYLSTFDKQVTDKSSLPTLNDIIKTVHQLMESSPLGEYEARLNIVLSIHCQMINRFQKSRLQQEGDIMKIFWNVYQYYNQFSKTVKEKIIELRKPIEKEVKDFVKIARWNDINFWAMKQTVAKSHQTLHKHMKQYEKILSQPAKSSFYDPESIQSLITLKSENSDKLKVKAKSYITSLDVKPAVDIFISKSKMLPKLNSLFTKCKKLCRRIVRASEYPSLIQTADQFTGEVIEVSNDLQSQEIIEKSDKKKRMAEAKHLQMRKQRALADLFKTLTKIGLSYRKGLINWQEDKLQETMMISPVDVNAALKSLPEMLPDWMLLEAWRDCPKYLCKCISRLALLKSSTESPNKELGLPNIDRICGFPSHLFDMTKKLYSLLAESEENFVNIRLLLSRVSELNDLSSDTLNYTPQKKVHEFYKSAEDLIIQSFQTLQQFQLLLCCCPKEKSDSFQPNLTLNDTNLPGFTMLKNSPLWEKLQTEMTELLKELEKLQILVRKYTQKSEVPVLLTGKATEDLNQVFYVLNQISERLEKNIVVVFVNPVTKHSNCFIESIQHLCKRIKQNNNDFLVWNQSNFASKSELLKENPTTDVVMTKLTLQAEKLIRKILFSVQSIYKNCKNKEPDQVEHDPENEVELLENHMTKLLHQSLNEDIAKLNIVTISNLTFKFVKKIILLQDSDFSFSVKEASLKLLVYVYPILQQYCLFSEFFLTELVACIRISLKMISVLVKIFTELMQKGFCLPEELSEELSREGTSEFQDIEDGGLGEGEGVKDVSDKITSEDQLEESHQEGKEEKPNDPNKQPDIKEEDQAIEMSEDFEGKTHDLEADENDTDSDNKDEEEEEEELDKKMGDLEQQEADKLDDQIWGSDSDDENASESEDDKEEFGPGSGKESESNLVAKDDNKDTGEDENDESKDPSAKEDLDNNEETHEINEQDKREYEGEKPDPYQNQDLPKDDDCEPMDLPEDLKLDAEEGADGEDESEMNEDKDITPETKEDETNQEEIENMDAEENEEAENKDEGNQMEEDPVETKEKEETLEIGNEEDAVKEEPEQEGEGSEKEEEKDCSDEVAEASKDTPSADIAEAADYTGKESSVDKVDVSKNTPNAELDERESAADEAVGMKETEDSEGKTGRGNQKLPQQSHDEHKQEQKPKHSSDNENKNLGSIKEQFFRDLQTVDSQSEKNKEKSEEKKKADTYEHTKADEEYDTQAVDAATLEQAQQQPVPNKEDESDAETVKADDEMEIDNEEQKEEEDFKGKASVRENTLMILKTENRKKCGEEEANQKSDECDATSSEETVKTEWVGRSEESTIHTQLAEELHHSLTSLEIEQLRAELERSLSCWPQNRTEDDESHIEAMKVWHQFETITLPLAQELCEQLRLILEPSLAARLCGDFRTGKRLNMKKVIPYIASQFRKDKIWLRRSKPSKRQYRVLIAVDDSSSMADNKVKELAFESLAVISKALTLVEAGDLGIASFGESFRLLHQFQEQFCDNSGARILEQFKFLQTKTRIAELLSGATAVMTSQSSSYTTLETSQLLIIISDGRGLFSEGVEIVKTAIRRAREANIFMVFVILDLASNKDSILDIRVPVFKSPGQMPEFKSYMDDFPFPFYIILRDVTSLPSVLSDALRQWFELVTARQ